MNGLSGMTHDQLMKLLLETSSDHPRRRRDTQAVNEALEEMETLGRALHLCRECFQRRTSSQYTRYCYVTCHAPNNRLPVMHPDPDGTLRLAFAQPPTLEELQEEYRERKRRQPGPQ